ncbi:MAG: glutamine synthetase, partial [Selenomonadaceae bacterium]|nr:glutamine synthetase [Selenomonadaceae bacterium]
FELRACNPYTNTYLVLAAVYSAILDGIKFAVGRPSIDLLTELSKKAGQESLYLEKNRAYRSEEDVFEDYTAEERDAMFGAPPATVWENMTAFEKYPAKVKVISAGGALRPQIIKSFKEGALLRWKTELLSRILPEMRNLVRKAHRIETDFRTDQDSYNWNKIKSVREYLAKDSIENKSLFTRLSNALKTSDFESASKLQVEMYDKIEELKQLYDEYAKNMI